MNIKFTDIIKVTKKTCGKYTTHVYSIPCELDKNIANFMSNFGKPKFDLNTIKFLHIESADDYIIKGRLKRTSISITIAKESKNISTLNIRKTEFENNITKWIENKLGISIIR
jgi:hypothetical protein